MVARVTVEFRLVDIGEGLTEAEIVSWLVAVGDHVVEDQPVVEIETDKAVVEMPAPATGIVVALGGEPGQVIAVGELLVTIDEDGDAAAPGRRSPATHAAPPRRTPPPPPPPRRRSRPGRPPATDPAPRPPRAASPADSVSISTVVGGTGPSGRITDDDVTRAAAGDADDPAARAATAPAAAPPVHRPTPGVDERGSPARRAQAHRRDDDGGVASRFPTSTRSTRSTSPTCSRYASSSSRSPPTVASP